jgi:PTH1 family peptidyl-tRNA hydrolase
MKLIVGLGNPGAIYLHSRHNIGFSVVKALAKDHQGTFRKEKDSWGWVARVRIRAQPVILAMPATFMNLSGRCVGQLLRKYKLEREDLLVVCDDLDLEFGRMKLRPAGSSGGHRGLESIIEVLQSKEFARLKIGVGRPPEGRGASEHVLLPFDRKEKVRLGKVIKNAAACLESWVAQGISKTMNTFNRKGRTE